MSNNTNESQRNARVIKSSLNSIVGTLLFVGILVGIYWLAGKSDQKFDLTQNKRYTLSDSTANLLKKLDDQVTITVYSTESGMPAQLTEKRNELRQLLSKYRTLSGGKILYSFRDVTPETESEAAARDAGMEVLQVQEYSSTELSFKRGYFGLRAEYKGKAEPLPAIGVNESLEYQLTRVINKIASISVPKVGVLAPSGNPMMGQQSPFSLLPQVLESEDFEVVNLQPGSLSDLEGIEFLMVLEPQTLSEEAMFHIDQYVMDGGKLFVAANGAQMNNQMGMETVTPTNPAVNQLIEHYGLKIDSNLVEDWGGASRQGAMTRAGTIVQYLNPLMFTTSNTTADNMITSNVRSLAFAFASTVSRSDLGTSGTVTSLVKSSENSRIQEDAFITTPTDLKPPTEEEKLQPYDLVMMVSGVLSSRFAELPPPVLTKDDGTTRAVDATEVIKRSKDTASVVVAGSSTFLLDQVIQQRGASMNVLLPLNIAESFTRGSDMMALRSRDLNPAELRKVTPAEGAWTQILIIGGIPALVVAFGFLNLLRNRRRKARYRRMYGQGV